MSAKCSKSSEEPLLVEDQRLKNAKQIGSNLAKKLCKLFGEYFAIYLDKKLSKFGQIFKYLNFTQKFCLKAKQNLAQKICPKFGPIFGEHILSKMLTVD